jgi:K(+)-stimulated pyrophosphate-energized sodium pump
MKKSIRFTALIAAIFLPAMTMASEADLKIPDSIKDQKILYWGFLICGLGLLFGLRQFIKVKKLPAHKAMLEVSEVIYKTCSAYLKQQGKFLAILFLFIGSAVAGYFGFLAKDESGVHLFSIGGVLLIIGWTVVGILGSYSVAAFGIRMNTLANSRMAFASLKRKPLELLKIPLNAGMSIGVVLICVELMMMLIILLLMPGNLAGACFIGFAIGESLGASALRIAGGIFTKIADIGSDLMKVVFKIGEDDPRNPGVIADCTGDNAGDSVGPTADGFETYGVTGVALISFILLAVTGGELIQTNLLVWIFVMRILMIITSIVAFWINGAISKAQYGYREDIDFEKPLTNLVWTTSLLSIAVTFLASYLLIPDLKGNTDMWWILSTIISCGTIGGAVIPEFTKIFTSPKSTHVKEVVNAGREGGASLVILSGFVAGNFSAFWEGLVFFFLMFIAFCASTFGLSEIMIYPSVFAFGLVAFGLLGMGPVTIAVDSYGPVTDNAQSVYELSLIEDDKSKASLEIQREFGFIPDWEKSKYYLEANDGAGNTFKATAKPVLIGTAVVGATTMIFSLILMIKKTLGVEPESILNLLNPYSILGLILGGAVIYWFTGAATQAVTTGAFRAVEYIKRHINLDPNAPKKADVKSSTEVVKICTQYAQKGMFNIFVAVFFFALAFACFSR